MMSTILFYLTVSVLMPLLARSNDLPPLPYKGVRLYVEYNNVSYPNNSMIPANHFYQDNTNNDGLNDTLWCQSAKNEYDIGVWYNPNGTQVSTVDDSSPLYSVHMLGQIGLYHDVWLNNSEGIYRCVIQDECNVNQTLIIALYNMNTYENNRGPKIIETTFKSLLSTRDHSSFLISFNVTNGTATYINCTLNDTLIYPNITQIILSYQLPTKILVELLFQSRDEGWYNRSVSNYRVEDEHFDNKNQAYPAHNNIYVKVAKKPLNVTAKWINSSDVLITWSPPVNNNPLIDGYEVFYDVNDCDCKTFSVGVTNYTELIISGLCSTQNYSFFIVSYSNEEHTLPSEWSDVTTLIAVNELTSSSVNKIILSSTLTSSIDINDVTTPNAVNEVTSSPVNEIKLPSTLTSSVDINDFTTPNTVNKVTPSSVSEIMLLSILTSSIDINDITIPSAVNELTSKPVNEIMLSSTWTSSIDINDVTTPNAVTSVNEVTSSPVNEIKLSSTNIINRATLSSSNEITIIVKPSPSYLSNDHICKENSQLLSSWLIIGVGILLFTNIITVIVFIISCLWLQRKKYEKFDVMIPQKGYAGQYLSSRNGIIVESELKDENLYLRNDGNEEDDNSHSSYVNAVVNKNKDNNGSPINSTTTTADMNDEMTV